MVDKKQVTITEFYWGGTNFFYTIKTHCADCDTTKALIESIITKELKDYNVNFEFKPWFNNFWYCLLRATWHAPIVMINDKKFWQYSEEEIIFKREALVEAVKKAVKEES
jgi:hypothetical protein